MHSGFECPTYGVIVPKDYKIEKDKDGIIWLIPPKGAEVPKDLKYCCKEAK